MRSLAGIVSTALITAALVIAVEVGVTLAWAEPVTNLRGYLGQQDAAEQLEDLEDEFRLPGGGRFRAAEVPALARRLAAQARPGQGIGRIRIPAIDVDVVAVEGTATEDLKRGPGHYTETALPGAGRTSAFAGHRTTYGAPFRHLDRLGKTDEIVVEMPYASLTYGFERQRIVEPSAVGVVRDIGRERLVLTACHPVYSAAERIVVFARLLEVDPPAGSRAIATAPPTSEAGFGLGPTLLALALLAPLSAAMWFFAGRRS